jgi:hypothetical protein
MKMAEILRKIADLMDQDSDQNRLEPVDVDTPDDEEQPVMVPPLQAKLEILKKSEGIPNVYDEGGEEQDELSMLKQRAGLTPVQQEASEDNDIVG